MTDNTLRKTIILAAPRETVWDYLTQPNQLAKWFHAPKTPCPKAKSWKCLALKAVIF